VIKYKTKIERELFTCSFDLGGKSKKNLIDRLTNFKQRKNSNSSFPAESRNIFSINVISFSFIPIDHLQEDIYKTSLCFFFSKRILKQVVASFLFYDDGYL